MAGQGFAPYSAGHGVHGDSDTPASGEDCPGGSIPGTTIIRYIANRRQGTRSINMIAKTFKKTAEFPPGTELAGRYEIIARSDQPGGNWYDSLDRPFNRQVMVLTLPAGTLQHGQRRAGFLREARLLSRLDHPHIAGIHGFDSTESCDFVVTEHVSGRTLAERLNSGQWRLAGRSRRRISGNCTMEC